MTAKLVRRSLNSEVEIIEKEMQVRVVLFPNLRPLL